MNHLVKHVIDSFNNANMFKSKLDNDIMQIEGMSGYKTRHLYNNLCSLKFPDRKTGYLEVGTWKGSSFISAMYNNTGHVHGTVIDNWSEFGGPRKEFDMNMFKFNINDQTIIEADFFKWDPTGIPKIDIYLYDGGHTYNEQYNAIIRMWEHLADECIIVVDDWNGQQVRGGTNDALENVKAVILEKFEITYVTDQSHTPMEFARREFWNGIGVFVVKKRAP